LKEDVLKDSKIRTEPSPFVVLSSKTTYRFRHLSVEEERLRREDDGGETDYYTVRHPGAVVILPLTNDGELLILRQYRHTIKQWIYEFPAGTLDPHEQPETCAHRELQEETGFKAASLQPLGHIFPAPGFCDEVQYGFIATGLTPSSGELDDDEFLEVLHMTQEEFSQKIKSQEIIDAKTLAFYARALASDFLNRP
jgi:ADP-ribose pyrophosphatase